MAEQVISEYAFEGAKRYSTSISWSFETQTYAADANYPFSSSIDPLYRDTIRSAFARWASVSGLSFVESADAPTDAIRIGFGTFASAATVGETVFRYSSGFFRPDTIVRLLDPAASPLVLAANGQYAYASSGITLYQVVLHEIGHALGLAHTTNPATLMYPVASAQNTDLAPGDVQGIDTLYPFYTAVALDPVQVEGNTGVISYHFMITRHGDPAAPLTTTYAVTGLPYAALAGTAAATASEFVGGAFPSGELTFAAGMATAMLTVNVASNRLAQPDQGFAISVGSAVDDQATTRGGINALILDDDGGAGVVGTTLGVYRFFSTVDGAHFLTASEQERNALVLTRTDLTYEGAELTAIARPDADPAAAAVFRFFDTRHGTHFYTASAAERDATQAGRADLAYEGIGFYEHVTAQPGDAPVFRFFDQQLGTHFYTSSMTERATVAAARPDMVDEGVSFYTPASV